MRTLRTLRTLLLACLALLPAVLPSTALAHKPSDSYLIIHATGDKLEGQWDIALRDLEYAMGLDADGLDNAIGIALNLAPMATGRTNQIGSAKWLFGGQACTSGLLAAEMSGHGFKGMRDVVGGWLNLVSEQNHPERLTEGIDAQAQFTQWELLSGVVTKYHATIGPLVSPIEAVFSLLQQHDIRPEDVVEIHADCTHRTAVFNKPHPENEVTARASLPYCIAVALHTGDAA